MEHTGKLILMLGLLLVVLGAGVWGLGKLGFRGLPGDIRYETEHLKVYIPLASCLVVSLLATLLLWLWQWLRKG